MAGISDITADIAAALDIPKTTARVALDAFLDAIIVRVDRGERVILKDFGVFSLKTCKARTCRNPQTGASIEIPEKVKLVFKASK